MCLIRHFRTFEPLCTPPHKTQKSCQSDHRTIRFCNGLGRHPNLRITRHSKNAFKPTFSSLWCWMRLNRHFHTFELLRTPPHKLQKNIQNDHETVRSFNGLGRHPNLGILRYFGTSGWLESEKAWSGRYFRPLRDTYCSSPSAPRQPGLFKRTFPKYWLKRLPRDFSRCL